MKSVLLLAALCLVVYCFPGCSGCWGRRRTPVRTTPRTTRPTTTTTTTTTTSAPPGVFRYTVENQLTSDNLVFQASLQLPAENKTFYSCMEDAAQIDTRFRFRTRTHSEFGRFVIEVNGIHENPDLRRFWALLKRMDVSNCTLDVGVDTYVPHQDEHLVVAYETWDIFEWIPKCSEIEP